MYYKTVLKTDFSKNAVQSVFNCLPWMTPWCVTIQIIYSYCAVLSDTVNH